MQAFEQDRIFFSPTRTIKSGIKPKLKKAVKINTIKNIFIIFCYRESEINACKTELKKEQI